MEVLVLGKGRENQLGGRLYYEGVENKALMQNGGCVGTILREFKILREFRQE